MSALLAHVYPSLFAMATYMRGWQPATPQQPSFLTEFRTCINAVPDTSKYSSNRGTTESELQISAPSLLSLAPLSFDNLTLTNPAHNLEWAVTTLGNFAPRDPHGWGEEDLDMAAPFRIESEEEAIEFLKTQYLTRAMCAGYFLARHSSGLDSELCPNPTFYLKTTATTGPSGRPDRAIVCAPSVLGGQSTELTHSIAIEGKRGRVFRSKGGVHVLDRLSQFAAQGQTGGHVNWLTTSDTWETKGKQLLLQVSAFS
jgi:hypothetical protein